MHSRRGVEPEVAARGAAHRRRRRRQLGPAQPTVEASKIRSPKSAVAAGTIAPDEEAPTPEPRPSRRPGIEPPRKKTLRLSLCEGCEKPIKGGYAIVDGDTLCHKCVAKANVA